MWNWYKLLFLSHEKFYYHVRIDESSFSLSLKSVAVQSFVFYFENLYLAFKKVFFNFYLDGHKNFWRRFFFIFFNFFFMASILVKFYRRIIKKSRAAAKKEEGLFCSFFIFMVAADFFSIFNWKKFWAEVFLTENFFPIMSGYFDYDPAYFSAGSAGKKETAAAEESPKKSSPNAMPLFGSKKEKRPTGPSVREKYDFKEVLGT